MPPELARAAEFIASLPGIGRKTAYRIAFYLLRQNSTNIDDFFSSITGLREKIQYCPDCGALQSKQTECVYCLGAHRDRSIMCVVEQPSDIYSIESSGEYSGLYHVLMGVLSPLDGISASDLRLASLVTRAQSQSQIKEIIVATNPSVEGNATAHYIAQLLSGLPIKVSRIATGLALGSQLDYVDSQAISQSIRQRISISG